MITVIRSVYFQGLEPKSISVQVSFTNGLPSFIMVGLPSRTISESKERIRAALQNISLSLPAKKIIINLSPADIEKDGSHFDLAIMIGILCELDIISRHVIDSYLVFGEILLDGSIVKVGGSLPASIYANQEGFGVICPKENEDEALYSGNSKILSFNNIIDLIQHFTGKKMIKHSEAKPLREIELPKYQEDYIDIVGQSGAKRALEIAAVGGHNILLVGTPGSGKSMLAKRFYTILPPLTTREILECSNIHSIAGLLPSGKLVVNRPFRSPHSSASMISIVGGGKKTLPGEVTLAHNGVLFLDELPHFSSHVIDALRSPLEDHKVCITRANGRVLYPAKFQLIAAMNPCKCGNLYLEDRQCGRAPMCGEKYLNKISGPILDRFDIKVYVHSSNSLFDKKTDSSNDIRQRVCKAKKFAMKHRGNESSDGVLLMNSVSVIIKDILNQTMEKNKLSMRQCYKILRLSRSIADLEQSISINKQHLLEAISYSIG